MKKIHIIQYKTPDKSSVYLADHRYSFYLGEGKTLYFNSEKKIKKLIADTNRLLNSTLHECNYLYGEIFKEYRNAWFVFDSDKTRKSEIDIKNSIERIEKCFNWIATHSNYSTNYNAFIMRYLYNIVDALLNIAFSVRKLLLYRDEYHIIQKIDMYSRQIKILEKKLDNWGVEYLA